MRSPWGPISTNMDFEWLVSPTTGGLGAPWRQAASEDCPLLSPAVSPVGGGQMGTTHSHHPHCQQWWAGTAHSRQQPHWQQWVQRLPTEAGRSFRTSQSQGEHVLPLVYLASCYKSLSNFLRKNKVAQSDMENFEAPHKRIDFCVLSIWL